MTIVYIIIAILFFGLLVAIHEFGHFTVAKLCGVRVEEFAIGMGPAIFKKTKGETTYSLRCVPFGGFCAMTGEDGDEAAEDPHAFCSQKLWKKLLILVAGAFMNFLLGLVIVLILYADASAFRAPVLDSFMDGCPYEGADALQQGDRFYSIDGHRIWEYYDVSDYLVTGEEHDIVMLRDGKKVRLEDYHIVPVEYEGYENKMYGFYFGYDEATVLEKLRHSWYTCMEFAHMVWQGLEQLVTGSVGMDDLSGPVGIVQLMAESGESAATVSDGLFNIAYFGAFIAVNLAIMNLLPIPALDGGRVFLLLISAVIEKIFRKKPDPKYETYINAAGMILLLALMAFIMLHDVYRIFRG